VESLSPANGAEVTLPTSTVVVYAPDCVPYEIENPVTLGSVGVSHESVSVNADAGSLQSAISSSSERRIEGFRRIISTQARATDMPNAWARLDLA